MLLQEIKIFAPLLAPFITIFLGITAIPFIEIFKNYIDKKKLLKSLLEELKDEILNIDNEFELLYPCLANAEEIKNGEKIATFDAFIPAELVLFSPNKLLENHFQNINLTVRQSLKKINSMIDVLNALNEKLNESYYETMHNEEMQKNSHKLVDHLRAYLCNIIALRYHINYLIDILDKKESTLKYHHSVDFDTSVRIQLEEMKKIECYYNITI